MECGAHLNGRIEKARGADELLDDDAFALGELIFGGRRTDIEDAWGEGHRTPRTSAVYCPVLRVGGSRTPRGSSYASGHHRTSHGSVARSRGLVDDEEEVIREVVEETEGRSPG